MRVFRLLTLLLSVPAAAEVGVLPVEKLDKEGMLQAVQQSLDQAFSVNGGTVTGPVHFSSYTAVNGRIDFSSNAVLSSSGICFSDGTCQTTAPAAAATYASTATFITANFNGIGTGDGGECAAVVSTLTMTTAARNVRMEWGGTAFKDTAGDEPQVQIIVDGNFSPGFSASIGMRHAGNGGATERHDISFSYVTRTALTAASHTFCLNFTRGTGGGGTVTMECSARSRCWMRISEVEYANSL